MKMQHLTIALLLLAALLPQEAKAQTASISISPTSANEGAAGSNTVAATVTVSLTSNASETVAAVICFSGTATERDDYRVINLNNTNELPTRGTNESACLGDAAFQRQISTTETSISFRIQLIGDSTTENDETIVATLTNASGNTITLDISPTASSATFTIENDDFPRANFAAATSTADEDDGTVTVAVNLSENAILNTDVAYSLSGTAASEMDFSALSNTVQITSGSNTANISIPIIDDNTDEPNETIILTLSDSFGYKIGTPNVHTLTINDDDATPRITSLATASVAEGTTRVLTVMAMDDDNDDNDLTYSITAGTDSARFRINQSTGDLTFKTAPDFENPTDQSRDNEYIVEVTASDGTNNTAQTITITVTNVNEPPMLAPTATKSVAENTITVLTVSATDEDAGTILTYSISGGLDSVRFRIDPSTGALTFKAAPDFETPSDQGGDNDYKVIITVNDGTNSAMQTITVTVTDVNEPPVIVVQTFSVTENTTAGTTVGTVAGTDEDSDNLTFAITSGNTNNAFAINENTGVITVAGTIDHETTPTYTLTVQVSDDDLSATATVTINVTNENDNSPVITSPATASVVENTTAVLTVTATDADTGTTLTYSVSGGADRALFSINQTSGALTFITAPDFEGASSDGNDDYEVEVTASDGTNSVAQTITITVTDDPADNILSFSEAEEEAMVIFPNPSGDYLEVRSLVGGTFKILSLSGKPLLEGTTNTRVDIASLRGGLYLVQLPDGRLLKFVRE